VDGEEQGRGGGRGKRAQEGRRVSKCVVVVADGPSGLLRSPSRGTSGVVYGLTEMDSPTDSLQDLDVPRGAAPVVSIVLHASSNVLRDGGDDLLDVKVLDLGVCVDGVGVEKRGDVRLGLKDGEGEEAEGSEGVFVRGSVAAGFGWRRTATKSTRLSDG
jgi:hypothetical protein